MPTQLMPAQPLCRHDDRARQTAQGLDQRSGRTDSTATMSNTAQHEHDLTDSSTTPDKIAQEWPGAIRRGSTGLTAPRR